MGVVLITFSILHPVCFPEHETQILILLLHYHHHPGLGLMDLY